MFKRWYGLLCIKKVRVSYKNRYDLPESSQKEYENLVETLVREFQEETGYRIENYGQSRVMMSLLRKLIVQYIILRYFIMLK